MKAKPGLCAVILLASYTFSCAGNDPASEPVFGPGRGSVDTGSDLGLGARGDQVRALNRYLGSFGYFPSANLARQYPAWRPFVARAPAVPDVFDEQTAQGVRAFQAQHGLAVTGVVDEATRQVLAMPRCQIPDGVSSIDPSDKFNLFGPRWVFEGSLTWKLNKNWTGTKSGVTTTQFTQAVANAFETWRAKDPLLATFQRDWSQSANFTIEFATPPDSDDPNVLGSGYPASWPANPSLVGHIYINPAKSWSVASPTPANAIDLQSTLIHEIGHVWGMAHSTFQSPVMYPGLPAGIPKRTLQDDDLGGIRSLYGRYDYMNGVARDIGANVGETSAGNFVWMVGVNRLVYLRNESISGWNVDNTLGATADSIAVAYDGRPWVVTTGGQLLRRTTADINTGSWDTIPLPPPGIAGVHDIALSFDVAWALGGVITTQTPPPNGCTNWKVNKLTASGWQAATQGLGGVRIGVGISGIPWVVNCTGQIYQLDSSNPTGAWTLQPGSASDVATNPNTYVAARDGNFQPIQVYVRANQPALSNIPAVDTWFPQIASPLATRVAVENYGTLWIVGTDSKVYRSVF